ncbi:MAG TPA: alkyl hydroperoxide reductase subunit F, partial [Rhodoferax sp.]
MLDLDLQTQLAAYLQRVTRPFEMVASLDESDNAQQLQQLLQQIQGKSDKISLRLDGNNDRKPSFTLQRTG